MSKKISGTILYYTSNRENPELENKIIQDMLKKKGDLPIISVSQKPMDLGTNICVGDVGTSGYNICRQIQIACEVAKTEYVITVEADCIYSPDYFTFVPPRLDTCYRNSNIYILGYKRNYFSRKSSSIFAQVIGREFYMNHISKLFGDAPKWNKELRNWPKEWGKRFFDSWETFETEYPCISLKTGLGMRIHSAMGSTEFPKLPYWGSAKNLRTKLNI